MPKKEELEIPRYPGPAPSLSDKKPGFLASLRKKFNRQKAAEKPKEKPEQEKKEGKVKEKKPEKPNPEKKEEPKPPQKEALPKKPGLFSRFRRPSKIEPPEVQPPSVTEVSFEEHIDRINKDLAKINKELGKKK